MTARYIIQNPVRAGLVADLHDYPLCGSFEFELSTAGGRKGRPYGCIA